MYTEFRTLMFKDIVKNIATIKGWSGDRTFSFNLSNKGVPKPLRINGVSDSYIAYFKIREGNTIKPIGITSDDYKSYIREIKTSRLLGDPVEVKSFKKIKIKKEATWRPKVGDYLRTTSIFGLSGTVQVTKMTPKGFKFYSKFGGEGLARLSDSGGWLSGNIILMNDVATFDWKREIEENEYEMRYR